MSTTLPFSLEPLEKQSEQYRLFQKWHPLQTLIQPYSSGFPPTFLIPSSCESRSLLCVAKRCQQSPCSDSLHFDDPTAAVT